MADLKISALPASTTPLVGTEVLPIVQSSATVKVSVANLTAGRAVSMQSVTANNTGLGTPVANFQSGDQSAARVAIINSGAGGQTYHLVTGNPGVSNSGFALFDSTNSATRLYVGSSTGDLTVNSGNLVIGTSGKGISLPGGITWTSGSGSPEGVVTVSGRIGIDPTALGTTCIFDMDVPIPATLTDEYDAAGALNGVLAATAVSSGGVIFANGAGKVTGQIVPVNVNLNAYFFTYQYSIY